MSTPTTVWGNLTKNRYFQEATSRKGAYIRLTVATSERYRGEDGEFHDSDTSYINLIAFGRVAENIEASFPEGESHRIVATGKLDTSGRNVIFLSKDNVEEVQDARKAKEDIAPDDLEFGKYDRLGLATETTLKVEAIGPDLRYATVEVTKNKKAGDDEDEGGSKKARRTRKSRDEDDEEEETATKRTRRTRKSKPKDEDDEEAEDSTDETSDEGEDEGEAEAKAPRTRRTRRTRSAKAEKDF